MLFDRKLNIRTMLSTPDVTEPIQFIRETENGQKGAQISDGHDRFRQDVVFAPVSSSALTVQHTSMDLSTKLPIINPLIRSTASIREIHKSCSKHAKLIGFEGSKGRTRNWITTPTVKKLRTPIPFCNGRKSLLDQIEERNQLSTYSSDFSSHPYSFF